MRSISENRERIFNLSCFGYKAFILLWAMCGIYTVAVLLATNKFFFAVQGNVLQLTDFIEFYKCGKIVCSSTPQLLYDLPTQMVWLNKIIAPAFTTTPIFSPYTPPLCLVMAALSLCPMVWAYLIWMLGTGAFAFFALWCLLATVGHLTKEERVLFLLAVFSSLENLITLRNGQCCWLILGTGALFITCFLKRKDLLAGVCLSVIAIKPQYALFFMLPALAGKRFKIIGSAVFCTVIQYAFAGLILGWRTVFDYPKAILFDERQIVQGHFTCGADTMACLRGFLALFTDPSFNFSLCSILMVAALVLLFFLWLAANTHSADSVYGCLSLTILLSLLLIPHVFFYDYLLLAIPAALTLKTLNPLATTKYSCRSEQILLYTFLAYPCLSIIGFITRAASLGIMRLEFFFVHSLILALTVCYLTPRLLDKNRYFDFKSLWSSLKAGFVCLVAGSLALCIAIVRLSIWLAVIKVIG